jgi:hypothetical protein
LLRDLALRNGKRDGRIDALADQGSAGCEQQEPTGRERKRSTETGERA